MPLNEEDNSIIVSDIVSSTLELSTSSAKDVPCLVDGPEHNWYEKEIYMKCSKCGMSYEKPASKDFQL